MSARLSRAWGILAPAAHLDRPVGHRRLARHHLLRSGSSPASSTRASPLDAYGALISGSVGVRARHRQHARQHDAAPARRPGGRPRLQGRPVQHRRPGPVPDGRPRLGHRRRPAARRARRSSPIPSSLVAGHDLRRRLGLHPGLPQGGLGRPRSRHHDHAQLRRHRDPGGGGQRAAQRRRLGRRRSRSPSATRRSRSSSAGTARSRSSTPRSWPSCTASCCSGRRAGSRSGSPARARTPRATPGMSPRALIIWTMTVSGMLGGHGRRDRAPRRDPPR